MLDIGLVQEAERLQAAIAIAPALDVRQVLGARQRGAEADALVDQRRVHGSVPCPAEQLAAHPVRHPSAIGGIDEVKEDHMRKQHRPEAPEAIDQASPVHGPAGHADEVGDVGAIEALALHDEGLRPQHLLGRDEAHLVTEHLGRTGVLEPDVIHHGEPVAGSEDDVDEVLTGLDLAEPVLRLHLRVVAVQFRGACHAQANGTPSSSSAVITCS